MLLTLTNGVQQFQRSITSNSWCIPTRLNTGWLLYFDSIAIDLTVPTGLAQRICIPKYPKYAMIFSRGLSSYYFIKLGRQ